MAWAFVAHKDGYWAGVCAADMKPKELKKFIGGFVEKGFSITTVNDRSEYDTILKTMKFWHDSPEWKMKHEKPANRSAA